MYPKDIVLPDELVGLVTDKHMKERVTTVTLATSPNFFGSRNLPRESPNRELVRTLKHQIMSSLKGLVISALMESIQEMKKTYYMDKYESCKYH